MALGAGDIASIADRLTVTVEDLAEIVPASSTVAAQVALVGDGIWAEMQSALRDRHGDLPDPLPADLLDLCAIGVLAELLALGYRRLPEEDKAWPDMWRSRFENRLAELAAGVAQADVEVQQRRAGAVSSQPGQFTLSADRAATLGVPALSEVL